MKKIICKIDNYIIKHDILMRIVLGTLFTGQMMVYILMENNKQNEQMNVTQLIVSFIGIFYVCFGIPWGFCRLKMIQWEQFQGIPLIGIQVYIIVKIGISCIIGTPIMICDLLKWIVNKKRVVSENTWMKAELEREKNSKYFN